MNFGSTSEDWLNYVPAEISPGIEVADYWCSHKDGEGEHRAIIRVSYRAMQAGFIPPKGFKEQMRSDVFLSDTSNFVGNYDDLPAEWLADTPVVVEAKC